MPQLPPNVDVIKGTEELKSLVEQVQEAEVALANYLNTMAVTVHPQIIQTMIQEGANVYQQGRFFGGGMAADKAADAVHDQMKKTAEYAVATGKSAEAVLHIWNRLVKGPVEAARAAKASQPALTI